MKREEVSLYVCFGYMIWGCWVDAQGLPVFDQVVLSAFFGVVALFLSWGNR